MKKLNHFFPPEIRVLRPVHAVKNLALFAALIFTGRLFVAPLFTQVFWAFVIFTLAGSATYIFNDLLDRTSDQHHPIKKHRPIASGELPIPVAIAELALLVPASLFLANRLNHAFFVLLAIYLGLQLAYSLFLKNLAIIDILIIATGFIIRIYAGAFVIDAHLSVWFLLCVVSVALFLASGKRRAELGLTGTRASLSQYPRELLNSYVTMFGASAWLSWSLFTFFESPQVSLPVWLLLAQYSRTTTVTKVLMITIPIAIFAIMRYEKLIFEDRAEAPEKLLLTDIPLTISIALWTLIVIWILYSGVAVPYAGVLLP